MPRWRLPAAMAAAATGGADGRHRHRRRDHSPDRGRLRALPARHRRRRGVRRRRLHVSCLQDPPHRPGHQGRGAAAGRGRRARLQPVRGRHGLHHDVVHGRLHHPDHQEGLEDRRGRPQRLRGRPQPSTSGSSTASTTPTTASRARWATTPSTTELSSPTPTRWRPGATAGSSPTPRATTCSRSPPRARSPGLRCCRRSRRRSRPTWQRQRASRTAWWARPTGSRPCPPTSSGGRTAGST